MSCFTPGFSILFGDINMLYITVRNTEKMVTGIAIPGVLLKIQVMFFTPENAADLHGVGIVPARSRRRSRRKHIVSVKNRSLYRCVTFFPVVTILRCFVGHITVKVNRNLHSHYLYFSYVMLPTQDMTQSTKCFR